MNLTARYTVSDPMHQGMPVYALAIPEGWAPWSEVLWNLQHTAQPVTLRCVVRDPASPRAMEFWPTLSLFWVEPDMGFVAPDTFRNGQVALPPMPAAELMARWLLPRVRGSLPGFQITAVQHGPDLAQRFSLDPWDGQPEGVVARVTYQDQGAWVDEEFAAVKVLRACPTTGPLGGATQLNWGFERLASFRAERGGLDALRPVFWQAVASVQVNPRWTQLAAQVAQQLNSQYQGAIMAEFAHRQQAIQQHQQWMDHMHAVQARSQEAFNARMAPPPPSPGEAPRERYEQVNDLLGGERTYYDDTKLSGESKHPAGYQYVFTDGQGHYQYSNDPLFDPNVNASQTWTLMREKA